MMKFRNAVCALSLIPAMVDGATRGQSESGRRSAADAQPADRSAAGRQQPALPERPGRAGRYRAATGPLGRQCPHHGPGQPAQRHARPGAARAGAQRPQRQHQPGQQPAVAAGAGAPGRHRVHRCQQRLFGPAALVRRRQRGARAGRGTGQPRRLVADGAPVLIVHQHLAERAPRGMGHRGRVGRCQRRQQQRHRRQPAIHRRDGMRVEVRLSVR
jgi:hypothetical protein